MSKIKIGTYNVNNLFDRFDDPYNWNDDPWRYEYRKNKKNLEDLYNLGERIRKSDVDILAIQEVESFGALKEFIAGHTGSFYKVNGVISLESNDPRGIDLVAASKFSLGRVISHRFRKYNGYKVFSRDCLQVEVILPNSRLLTLFICHLKSKYSPYTYGTSGYLQDKQNSTVKRQRQIDHTIEIIKNSGLNIDTDYFAILGDMNDTPDSAVIKSFFDPRNQLKLHDGFTSIGPANQVANSKTKRKRDTHKYENNPAENPPATTYSQLDHVFVSDALNKGIIKAKVEQRGNTTGSDHYLCWIELDLNLLP